MAFKRKYATKRKRGYTGPVKSKRRRFNTSKRRSNNFASARQMRLGGFPQRMCVKLRYVQEATLSVGATVSTSVEFKANDVYDPDYSGVGHQPMGFDQWMTVYDHFQVIGSKISVRPVISGSTSPTIAPYWGIVTTDATGRYNGKTLDYILEMSGTERGRHGLNHNWSTLMGPGLVKTAKYSMRKFFGSKKLGQDKLIGSASASPTEDVMFALWGCGIGGADPATVNFIVQIDYIVVFTEAKTLPQS